MGDERSRHHDSDRHGKRRTEDTEDKVGQSSRSSRREEDDERRRRREHKHHHSSSRREVGDDEKRHARSHHSSRSSSQHRHEDEHRRSHYSYSEGRNSRRKGSDSESNHSRSPSRHADDRRHEHRRKREHDDKRYRHHSHRSRRHGNDEDESRDEHRERKREHKVAKAHKDGRSGAVTQQFGRFGIIGEADVTSRLTAEFRQWLVEERHINPESIARAKERKEMATFIEDFNTATLPNEKYYNLDAHERKMALIRAGEAVRDDDDFGGGSRYDPLADERAAKATFKAQQRAAEQGGDHAGASAQGTWHSKAQLEELRRVQKERIEAVKMRQLGLQTSASMGVRMDGTRFDKR